MCFTISVHTSRKAIEKRFAIDTAALLDFDYNYFYRAFANPMIPVISSDKPDTVQLMEWGLIPSWVRDREHALQVRKGTYNARAESIHEKASFREAFSRGRCLILANGFFEWQHVAGEKIPWFIRLKEGEPFAFAGLSERWKDPDTGEISVTCSIITTRANPLMEKIHNSQKRMPVILEKQREGEWINDKEMNPEKAGQLLLPLNQAQMRAHPVGRGISSRDADPADPSLIEAREEHIDGKLF